MTRVEFARHSVVNLAGLVGVSERLLRIGQGDLLLNQTGLRTQDTVESLSTSPASANRVGMPCR